MTISVPGEYQGYFFAVFALSDLGKMATGPFSSEHGSMPKPTEPSPPPGPLNAIVICTKCGHTMYVQYLEADGKMEKASYKCGDCGNEESVSRALGYDEQPSWPK